MSIKLQNQLNIRYVSELKEVLQAKLDAGSPVVIDASEVEAVDGAAVQLLVAFSQHAAVEGCEIEWLNPSEDFLSAARLTGLNEALGLTGC